MPDLYDDVVAIQIHEIYGEAHSEGVDSFTRNDPHAFSGREELTAQKALAAFAAIVGHIDSVCQLDLPGHIRNTHGPTRQCVLRLNKPIAYSLYTNHRATVPS